MTTTSKTTPSNPGRSTRSSDAEGAPSQVRMEGPKGVPSPRHPRVLVIGEAEEGANEVERFLSAVPRFDVTLVDPATLETQVLASARADVVVLVEELTASPDDGRPAYLRGGAGRLPLVRVVHDAPRPERASPPDGASELQLEPARPRAAHGSEALSWPRERDVLREVLSRGLSEADNRLTSPERRAALIRGAKIRSELEERAEGPRATVPLEVQGERVLVFARQAAAGRELGRVPAAMGAVTEAVRQVDPSLDVEAVSRINGLPDLMLRRVHEARRILDDHPSVDARAFLIIPREERLVLMGSARSREELQRVVTATRAAAGTTPIENLMVVDLDQHEIDMWRAIQLRRRLADTPIRHLDLAVCREMVYVRGELPDAEAGAAVRAACAAEVSELKLYSDFRHDVDRGGSQPNSVIAD